MEWTELTVTVPRQHADAATDAATALAEGGLYIEDYADLEQQVMEIAHVDLIEKELVEKPRDVVTIHLYISPHEDADEAARRLGLALAAAGVPHSMGRAGVRQEDWENSWKQYYHPVEIGRRLAIAPSWEEYDSKGRVVLRMDPGMAFGTGTHETTALCLQLLDEKVHGGERVLDIGCGSGILAIAALLLGAGCAEGVDIDPMAVKVAAENAQRNGVERRFSVQAGDLADLAHGPYNIITANIVADAILRLAPAVAPLLAPGGVFVASGIIDDREAEVAAGLAACGLSLRQVHRKNGWVALECTAAREDG